MNTMITDDILVAYVDGELESTQRKEVERALHQDPALREKTQAYAASAAFLRRGLEAKLHEPVPEHILRLFDCACETNGLDDEESAAVVPLSAARHRRRPALAPAQWAAAAALLLLVGGGAALFGAGFFAPGDGPAIAGVDAATARVLDREASGTPGEVMPLLTFRDRDGRLCREYELAINGTDKRQIQRSVACRTSSGGWSLVASTFTTFEPSPAGQAYVPAAGASGPAIDLTAQLIAGEPLTVAAEREAIENNWLVND